MVRKKIINVFLILVLSVQLLPVMQVGALLSSNQLTEEIPHGSPDGGGKVKFSNDQCKNLFCFDAMESLGLLSSLSPSHFVDLAETIPSNPVSEVQTPPPNC
ncbi:MAG: hypothetical protein C5B52_01000 [Bacteroidetes bacterium]|nr:MAG: hypothetical protein C5B52_01000 [Bacteroidota bacterium]